MKNQITTKIYKNGELVSTSNTATEYDPTYGHTAELGDDVYSTLDDYPFATVVVAGDEYTMVRD